MCYVSANFADTQLAYLSSLLPAVNKILRSWALLRRQRTISVLLKSGHFLHKSELELAVVVRHCKVFITCWTKQDTEQYPEC